MRRTVLRLAVLLFIAAVVAVGLFAWGQARYATPGLHGEHRTVIVERGAGIAAVANLLAAAGVIDSAWIFRAGTRVAGLDTRLKAGEYAIPAHASPQEIAVLLASGHTVVRRLTVVEGATTVDILRHIAAADGLVDEVKSRPQEGDLLPETYHFSYGDSREAVIRRMTEAMNEAVARLWAGRREGLPLANPQEALILASIVEKETGVAAERPMVAAVFLNRLRRGMRLQSDPTVAYGLAPGAGGLDRPLSRADLQAPSPYNTYVNAGLPPGPICNPGLAALAAVLQPAETDHLYFVADGTGGHAFARTLAEHNRNVRVWRRLQREAGAATVPPEQPPADNGEEAPTP